MDELYKVYIEVVTKSSPPVLLGLGLFFIFGVIKFTIKLFQGYGYSTPPASFYHYAFVKYTLIEPKKATSSHKRNLIHLIFLFILFGGFSLVLSFITAVAFWNFW